MVIELFVAMVSQLAVIMVENANAKADQVAGFNSAGILGWMRRNCRSP